MSETLPLGAVVSAYRIGTGRDCIMVESVRQIDGPDLWAVRQGGDCLNASGGWEWEPMPSCRDEEFKSRCRFGSASLALQALENSLMEKP